MSGKDNCWDFFEFQVPCRVLVAMSDPGGCVLPILGAVTKRREFRACLLQIRLFRPPSLNEYRLANRGAFTRSLRWPARANGGKAGATVISRTKFS